jgi:CAP-Gly domain-containing linker protein 1
LTDFLIGLIQDDLEREVERLKEKLARSQKKSSRSGIEPNGAPPPPPPTSSEEVCEICEQPGHDIFNCSLLKDEPRDSTTKLGEGKELICEDCEGRGHVAADCPHSLDVF